MGTLLLTTYLKKIIERFDVIIHLPLKTINVFYVFLKKDQAKYNTRKQMNRKCKNLSYIFRLQWARTEIYRSSSLLILTWWRNIRIQRKANYDIMPPVFPSFVDFIVYSDISWQSRGWKSQDSNSSHALPLDIEMCSNPLKFYNLQCLLNFCMEVTCATNFTVYTWE